MYRIPRETRICAHPDCSSTFEVRVTSSRKFCCVSCGAKGKVRSEEFKRNRSKNQKEQWQDLEYVRMQHAARLGRVGWSKGLTKETHPSLLSASEKKVGKKQSEETIAKKSKKLKGKSYVELWGEERAKEMIQIRSEAMKGEKSPFWLGGIADDPYPEEFVYIRKEIKARDGYQCQLCGKTEIVEKKKLGRGLSVHHVDYDKQNCVPENLITLCCSCHGNVNFNREYWEKFFEDMVRESILIV